MIRRLLLAIALILTAQVAVGAAMTVTITVRPDCEVTAATTLISDIAIVHSDNAALSEKIRNTELCASPSPGRTRLALRYDILIALRRAGIDDKQIELLSPERFNITRKFGRVTGQMIFQTAQDYAVATSTWPGSVAAEPARLPADLEVPVGKTELRVKKEAQTVRKGQNSIPVEIVVDGKTFKTVSVSLMLRVVAPVFVATQSISRGAAFTEANSSIEQRDITMLPPDILLARPATNSCAAMAIGPGSIIRSAWVAEPVTIHAGDSVLIIAQSGNIRVTDKGTAVQDGRNGQTIKIKLSRSAQEINAKVQEPGIVTIS